VSRCGFSYFGRAIIFSIKNLYFVMGLFLFADFLTRSGNMSKGSNHALSPRFIAPHTHTEKRNISDAC